MKEIVVDPLVVLGAAFAIIGIGLGWYIVRLDQLVEHLRDEVISIQKDIGKLQNADVTCTNDQTILKTDMSHIRQTLLRLVGRRAMRRELRRHGD
jgi:CcmD family protein